MKVERLDGFTPDGFGNVIEGEIVDGDAVRETDDAGNTSEHRWYAEVVVVPQPNTPGNPYFGKSVMATADFWALLNHVLGGIKLKRLLNDAYSIGVVKVIDKNDTINPDDPRGNFLKFMTYLTMTKGEDGALLLLPADAAAIMAAWK